MHQALNVWRTDRRAEGCISERGYSYIPHNLFGNKMGSVIKIKQITKKSQFLWWCDFDLRHMTRKSWSIPGTITTTVCTKFENNPPSAFWVIVLTICVEGGLNINHNPHPPLPPSFNNLRQDECDKQMDKEAWFDNIPSKHISPIINRVVLLLRSIVVLNMIMIA